MTKNVLFASAACSIFLAAPAWGKATENVSILTATQRSEIIQNIRIALAPMDNNWAIALIGKTLTDQRTRNDKNDQTLVNRNGFAQTENPRSLQSKPR